MSLGAKKIKPMQGYSAYGCGLMQLGLRWDDEDTLETTRWLTLFFMPIIPLSRWRVRYAGRAQQLGPDCDETFRFDRLGPLPLDPLGVLTTALCGWALGGVAVTPSIACITTIHGGANSFQLVATFAAACWPLAVVLWVRRRWGRIVKRPPSLDLFPGGSDDRPG